MKKFHSNYNHFSKVLKVTGLFLTLCLMMACEWDLPLEEFLNIKTLDKTEVEQNRSMLKIYGEISDLFEEGTTDIAGHVWSSENPEPTLVDNQGRTQLGKRGNGEFYSEIEDFSLDLKYYYRAYAIHQNETFYGEVKEFDIDGFSLTLTVDSLSDKSIRYDGSSATMHYQVSGLKPGVKIDNYGICWADHLDPTIPSDPFASEGFAIANGETLEAHTRMNALESAIYYVRPFVVQGTTTTYGPADTFKVDNFWIQKADFPGDGRFSGAAFTIDGIGYFGVGTEVFNGITPKKDLWAWDPKTNVWTQKADFEGGPRSYASSFALSGFGFIGLGFDDNIEHDDFWRYYPPNNKWVAVADFPGGNRANAIAFVVADKAYVGLGTPYFNGGTPFDDIYQYDPIANSWTFEKLFFPFANWRTNVFTIGDEAYIYNGREMISYNPIINQISLKSSFNSGMNTRSNSVAFSIGQYGYIGLGYQYPEDRRDMWQYNPQKDQWLEVASLPENADARTGALSFVIGDKAYVGSGNSDVLLTDFWEFNPPL